MIHCIPLPKTLFLLWREDDGVLSFEWILILTLLTIGIVSGLSAARDAIISELGDIAFATVSLDQTYTVAAFPETCGVSAPAMGFTDSKPLTHHCDRTDLAGQPAGEDCNDGQFPAQP